MPRLARILPLAALALAAPWASSALADPPPGRVEVHDEAGNLIGDPIAGADALQAAIARVRTARGDDARPWTIVAGGGTYGDVAVDEPNLTIRPTAGAAAAIEGTGGSAGTGGGCVDVRRGGVVLQGLACRGPAGRGVEVSLPAAEGGVVLRQMDVARAGTDGIAVSGGAGVLIEDTVVRDARRDGILFARVTGAGPYRVQGGAVRASGDDGIDLADDAQRVQVAGVTVEGSRDNGVESDDAGSTDLSVDASTIVRSGGDGVLLAGGGARLAVTNTLTSGSGDWGVELRGGSGLTLRGVRFDGTNRDGDLRFSTDLRAGGVYEGLTFLDTPVTLPGEPVGVILSSATPAVRAGLSPLPLGLSSLNRFVRVRDTGGTPNSVVALRFPLGPAELAGVRVAELQVYEDDRAGNARTWQAVPGSRVDGGGVEVTLGDAQIASGSDRRFATYAPFAPPNAAPAVRAVYPAPGAVVRGRTVIVGAAVADEAPLGTGSFALVLDGRRRGGVSMRGGVVRFRVGTLPLGVHRARLTVVDQSGLAAARDWSFTVRNGRPTVVRARAVPGPGAVVRTRGRVTLLIPVRDDDAPRRLRAGVRLDGRPVPARLVRNRLIARVDLRPGRHRLVVALRDRDGGTVARGWAFRTVRP